MSYNVTLYSQDSLERTLVRLESELSLFLSRILSSMTDRLDNNTKQRGASQSNAPGAIVYSDGVKLGWNILAIIGTLIFGLYVTSIVAPLRDNIQALHVKLLATDAATAALRKELTRLDKESAAASGSFNALRDSVQDHDEEMRHFGTRMREVERQLP